MSATKVRLEDLNSAPAAGVAAALATVFEHSPWIAEAATSGRPFASLAGLRAALLGVIASAPRDRRLALIRAHPDLANKTQRAAGLTDDSVAEQDGAGLDRLSDAEFAAFESANGRSSSCSVAGYAMEVHDLSRQLRQRGQWEWLWC